jgi:predicted dehydrogenase
VPGFGVGLVGFGDAGAGLHAPLIRATPGLELVAVATRDAERVRERLGAGVEVTAPAALLARPDLALLVIATPNDSHCALAVAGLESGKHVVVDKPFALDAAEARRMQDAARAAGRLLGAFHNRRWDSDFLTVRRLVAAGAVGRPVHFVSRFDRFRPAVRDRWRERRIPGAGLWLDLGPHLLDQAVQLFGWPDVIAADIAVTRPGALVDDWFGVRLRWERGPFAGLRAELGASMLAAHPGPRFTLHGTAASFAVDGLDAQEAVLKTYPPAAAVQAADWGRESRRGWLWRGEGAADGAPVALEPGAYPAFYAQWAQALDGRGRCPVPAAEAVAVQSLLDAGIASAAAGRELALPQPAAP